MPTRNDTQPCVWDEQRRINEIKNWNSDFPAMDDPNGVDHELVHRLAAADGSKNVVEACYIANGSRR